jgi:hypothetical protein
VVLIADLNEPLPADPFDGLKSRLFSAHQLTDIERVEKLQAMLPRGQQEP